MDRDFLKVLEDRFNQNLKRHEGICWEFVLDKLVNNKDLLDSIYYMEESGGQVDVFCGDIFDSPVYLDFSKESPKGRRSLCYDKDARVSRKKYPPKFSALEEASRMGLTILNEKRYYALQGIFEFDLKSSSWVLTEDSLRYRGGAIFCERRYGRVFTFHNGADSYYKSRGFRAYVKLV